MCTGIVEEVGTVVVREEQSDAAVLRIRAQRVLEGGPTLAAEFLRAGLVDEAVVHLAPRLLGAGPSLVGDLGISTMADALSLRIADLIPLGGDVQLRLRPNRHTGGRQHADGGA